MENINNNNTAKDISSDDINLRDILSALLKGKWVIISFTTLTSIIAVIYSLNLPNIYQSQAILVPYESGANSSNILGSYSGLASMAGIDLPTQASKGNSVKAIEKLGTLSFFENNILPNIFLPELMAVKSWNAKSNKLVFDNTLYDQANDKWIREYSFPATLIPSAQESFIQFKKQLSIIEDKQNGFVKLRVKHQSPYVAKDWTKLIVEQINLFYKENDKEIVEKSSQYLNNEMSKASYVEIKEAIAKLVQQETQKLALLEANDFYVFEYIDPPAVMEIKSEPQRSIICILGALIGGLIGTFIVLFRFFKD